ncbi:hypothetical protein EYF80_059770 [Liparis tanakae]|uniref:Uncharacterized protein n=1 Tax=Liparis tanakae TaxID=230148 RepID=A0A4Z2ENB8_9TELE|nr:hypothetical protein EYF80_059770 [Liparis tanakae]
MQWRRCKSKPSAEVLIYSVQQAQSSGRNTSHDIGTWRGAALCKRRANVPVVPIRVEKTPADVCYNLTVSPHIYSVYDYKSDVILENVIFSFVLKVTF